jgi:hypothetical protein
MLLSITKLVLNSVLTVIIIKMLESNQQIQFTTRDLQEHVSSKEGMYDLLLRVDYHLPAINCSLCTVYFMTEAYEGKLYCPLQSEVSQVYRLSWPSTQEVKSELITVIEANLAEHPLAEKLFELRRHLLLANADKQWMLTMLRHFNSTHRYFGKNFAPK